MSAPSNPKKQSLMPASKLRKALRAAGHHLSPVVQVGKEGLTPAVTAALDEQLLAHELIKVKIGTESPEDRFEVAAALASLPEAQVAQVLGRTVLLYRKHPLKPRYEAPDAATLRNLAAKAQAEANERPARRRRSPPRRTQAPRGESSRAGSRKGAGPRGAAPRGDRRPPREGAAPRGDRRPPRGR